VHCHHKQAIKKATIYMKACWEETDNRMVSVGPVKSSWQSCQAKSGHSVSGAASQWGLNAGDKQAVRSYTVNKFAHSVNLGMLGSRTAGSQFEANILQHPPASHAQRKDAGFH